MLRIIMIIFFSLIISACATTHQQNMQNKFCMDVVAGKQLFEEGYYRRAFRKLLPAAADGNPEAQYAIGYMYYYGYGVTQDTDAGYFWIQRSANQHYKPAEAAIKLIDKGPPKNQSS